MGSELFGAATPTDEEYAMFVASDWPPAAEARKRLEYWWSISHQYLDANFIAKAGKRFRPHFWEMYLAASLVAEHFQLTPRAKRIGGDAGPDLVHESGIAIEAVLATGGEGPDRVTTAPEREWRSVPDAQIRLRLLNAIDTKRKKVAKYVQQGMHQAGRPFVVAVNGSATPSARRENSVPRIVRAVFPVGDSQVHINTQSLAIAGTSYGYEPELLKLSGSRISTDVFLNDNAFRQISAVLYSCVGPLNHPDRLGADFIVVHNSNAASPLPVGALPAAWEFYSDGEQVHRVRGSIV